MDSAMAFMLGYFVGIAVSIGGYILLSGKIIRKIFKGISGIDAEAEIAKEDKE